MKCQDLASFMLKESRGSKKKSGNKEIEIKGLRKMYLKSMPKKGQSQNPDQAKTLATLKVEFEIMDVHNHSCMQAHAGQASQCRDFRSTNGVFGVTINNAFGLQGLNQNDDHTVGVQVVGLKNHMESIVS